MNIFVLDTDPIEAAKMHCDKHVPKMLVELYQQLGSAVRRHGATDDQMPLTQSGSPLKGGYHNHPCTRWVGETASNFQWAAVHALALACEYIERFNKRHACIAGVKQVCSMHWMIPDGDRTPFALAMPDKYRHDDAVTAYRDYYWCEKQRFAKWERGRPAPQWWQDAEKEVSDGND